MVQAETPETSFKDNWMKELDSEVAGGNADSQQIQPKSKTQLSRTVRPVGEQPPGLFNKEIGKDVLFGCESTNSRTGRPEKSCVPVSVERVDKDKRCRRKRGRRSNKNGETCEWTIVHSDRGNGH